MPKPRIIVDRFLLEKTEGALKECLSILGRFPATLAAALRTAREGLEPNEVHNGSMREVSDAWSRATQTLHDNTSPLWLGGLKDLADEIESTLKDRSGLPGYNKNDPYALVHAFAEDAHGQLVFRPDPKTGHPQAAFDADKLKRWHAANLAFVQTCLKLVAKGKRALNPAP